MMKFLGFIINPIAGMGGKVGLKGTNGVYEEAVRRGAKPITPIRAKEMLQYFLKILENYKNLKQQIIWYTCKGKMGEEVFKTQNIENYEIAYEPREITTSDDTKNACKKFIELKVDLIVFCGGDGTARDIYDVVERKIPIIGIPSGVKMHSAVFGVNPESVAHILIDFLNEKLSFSEVEILDLDEEKYRKGEWEIKLYGLAKIPNEPTYVQSGKAVIEEISEEEIKEGIADFIIEMMEEERETLFILSSGSTVQEIGKKLGIDTTLLGIDAVLNKKLIAKDVDEKKLLEILSKYKKAKLILSPIGAQGFILGRGNLQLSSKVIKKIGIDNIVIISTPAKLKLTPLLRVDTGDKELNLEFKKKGYMVIINDYHLMSMKKVTS